MCNISHPALARRATFVKCDRKLIHMLCQAPYLVPRFNTGPGLVFTPAQVSHCITQPPDRPADITCQQESQRGRHNQGKRKGNCCNLYLAIQKTLCIRRQDSTHGGKSDPPDYLPIKLNGFKDNSFKHIGTGACNQTVVLREEKQPVPEYYPVRWAHPAQELRSWWRSGGTCGLIA